MRMGGDHWRRKNTRRGDAARYGSKGGLFRGASVRTLRRSKDEGPTTIGKNEGEVGFSGNSRLKKRWE